MDEKEEKKTGEMSILDHLKELRNRIIFSLVAIVVCTATAGFFHKYIINQLVLGPAKNVGIDPINLKVFGQPIFYFKIVLVSGIILAVPVLVHQIWLFIKPALYQREVKHLRMITVFGSLFFFAGIYFAYVLIIPGMLKFASNFGTTEITNRIDINNYLSFLILIILSMGILFEMPVASFLMTKAGLISAKTLMKYLRHAIVVILLLAAIITPTPDPVSQLIFATPLFLLYILSIIIAKVARPRKTDTLTEENSGDENEKN